MYSQNIPDQNLSSFQQVTIRARYDLPLQNEDYDITLKYDELTLNDIQGRNALVMQYEDAAGRRRTEFQFVPKRKPVKFSGQRMILIMDHGHL